MSIQEQLAQSQVPSRFSFAPVYWAFPVEEGALGNQAVQMPSGTADLWRPVQGVNTPMVVVESTASESEEMAWLVRNASQLAQHKGEWLLIQGTQLVAHSRDFLAVRTSIQERQISRPFVYYVPTDDESNSVTI
jgi:hypothetical protein